MRPAEPNEPPPLPPDLDQQVRRLSELRAPSDNPYVLAPPPIRTGPDPATGAARLTQVGEQVADAGLASLSHFAILFFIFGITIPVSLGVSAFLWLYGRRSPYVAFHARQAGCYHLWVLASYVGAVILAGVLFTFWGVYRWDWAGPVLLIWVGLLLLWFPISILYGAWAGVRVLMGKDFRYPYIGRH